ncbi:hypothetical protein C8Q74DRAFT_1214380 [Fomes fomentarius]|nr:hypothetical protein C8Q74DRAFT_1214380 [Fomes fomentarius]
MYSRPTLLFSRAARLAGVACQRPPATPSRSAQIVHLHSVEKFATCFTREMLRHKEFEDCEGLKRIHNWFIFSVQSEGPYTPESLFPESIKVMRAKIAFTREAAEALFADSQDFGGGAVVSNGPDANGDVEMGVGVGGWSLHGVYCVINVHAPPRTKSRLIRFDPFMSLPSSIS